MLIKYFQKDLGLQITDWQPMQNIKSCFKRIYKTKIKQSLTVKSYRLGFKSWYLKLTGICKNSLKLKPVVVYLNE